MKLQFDRKNRVVSLENLKAMCRHARPQAPAKAMPGKGGESRGKPRKAWSELDTFVRAYITAAFWTWVEVEAPGGIDYRQTGCAQEHYAKLDPSALEAIEKDCAKFKKENEALLAQVGDTEQNGHDFWLTRNRHGVGFWDRGYGETGKLLTDAAHKFGECDIYTGDDGRIYL